MTCLICESDYEHRRWRWLWAQGASLGAARDYGLGTGSGVSEHVVLRSISQTTSQSYPRPLISGGS